MGCGTSRVSVWCTTTEESVVERPSLTVEAKAQGSWVSKPAPKGGFADGENSVGIDIAATGKFDDDANTADDAEGGVAFEHTPIQEVFKKKTLEGKCLVLDHFPGIDRLGSFSQLPGVPNFRKVDNFPVYGCGQPTVEGLAALCKQLLDKGHPRLIFFTMREECVVFINGMSYTPRDPNYLMHNLSQHSIDTPELEQQENSLQQEVRDAAKQGTLQVYHDVLNMSNEPHNLRTSFANVLTLRELHERQAKVTPKLQYVRVPITDENAPEEKDFDHVVAVLRDVREIYDEVLENDPALVFTCQLGRGRTTTGMVIGCLLMCLKKGFPLKGAPKAINSHHPDLQNGEYAVIKQLVDLFPNGLERKSELDYIIDACCHVTNLRSSIYECKQQYDALEGEHPEKAWWLNRCLDFLERYFYLLAFNIYLHDQINLSHGTLAFTKTFELWMKERPELYRMLNKIDGPEDVSQEVLAHRCMVLDHFHGIDRLGTSKLLPGVPNFRKVKGMPVYGMAQPTMKGLEAVVNKLLADGMRTIVSFNLREEPAIYLGQDGMSYSPREPAHLIENVVDTGITRAELEIKEIKLKQEILAVGERSETRQFAVYHDVINTANDPRLIVISDDNVKTIREAYEEQMRRTPALEFVRIPITDESAPEEKDFDVLVASLKRVDALFRPNADQNIALVFNCQMGRGRTTTGMVSGCLVMCTRIGFPPLSATEPWDDAAADYDAGQFRIIRRLCEMLPAGYTRKAQVDAVIDLCSEMQNIRKVIAVAKKTGEGMTTAPDRRFWRKRAIDFLERYFYLICFNAYLHDDVAANWTRRFSSWMKEHPSLYHILDDMDFDDDSFADLNQSSHPKGLRWRWRNHRKTIQAVK